MSVVSSSQACGHLFRETNTSSKYFTLVENKMFIFYVASSPQELFPVLIGFTNTGSSFYIKEFSSLFSLYLTWSSPIFHDWFLASHVSAWLFNFSHGPFPFIPSYHMTFSIALTDFIFFFSFFHLYLLPIPPKRRWIPWE